MPLNAHLDIVGTVENFSALLASAGNARDALGVTVLLALAKHFNIQSDDSHELLLTILQHPQASVALSLQIVATVPSAGSLSSPSEN